MLSWDSWMCKWVGLWVLCLLLGSFPSIGLSCPSSVCKFWFYLMFCCCCCLICPISTHFDFLHSSLWKFFFSLCNTLYILSGHTLNYWIKTPSPQMILDLVCQESEGLGPSKLNLWHGTLRIQALCQVSSHSAPSAQTLLIKDLTDKRATGQDLPDFAALTTSEVPQSFLTPKDNLSPK